MTPPPAEAATEPRICGGSERAQTADLDGLSTMLSTNTVTL